MILPLLLIQSLRLSVSAVKREHQSMEAAHERPR